MRGCKQSEQYERAVGVLVLSGRASTSFLQRTLGIRYNDAARLMERAEAEGIVSRPNSLGKREVLCPAPALGRAAVQPVASAPTSPPPPKSKR